VFCPLCGKQNPDQALVCFGCGKDLPKFASPPPPRPGTVNLNPNAPHARGKLLVVPRGAQLPFTCLKCGQPATRWVPIKHAWLNPALYLLILFGLIGIIIVAVLTKRMDLQTPLCEAHAGIRRQRIIAGAVLLLACVPVGILVGNLVPGDAGAGWGMLVGIVLFIGGIVALSLRNLLRPERIDDFGITLRGVHSSVLAQLGASQPITPTMTPIA